MQCEICAETTTVTWTGITDRVKRCEKCYRKFERESANTKSAINMSLYVKPESNMMLAAGPTDFRKCSSCGAYAGKGETIGKEFICDSCINNSTDDDLTYHMRLKLYGGVIGIEFFHFVMKKADPDWPYPEGKKCGVCNGMEYIDASFAPEEIKLVAKNCGVGKCKVKYWGKAVKCGKLAVVGV